MTCNKHQLLNLEEIQMRSDSQEILSLRKRRSLRFRKSMSIKKIQSEMIQRKLSKLKIQQSLCWKLSNLRKKSLK